MNNTQRQHAGSDLAKHCVEESQCHLTSVTMSFCLTLSAHTWHLIRSNLWQDMSAETLVCVKPILYQSESCWVSCMWMAFVVQFIVMSLLLCVNLIYFVLAIINQVQTQWFLLEIHTHTHLGWTHFMHCHLHLSSCQLCPACIKRVQIHTSRHTHWFNFRWQLHLRVLWSVCACVRCLFVLFWGAQSFTHYLK